MIIRISQQKRGGESGAIQARWLEYHISYSTLASAAGCSGQTWEQYRIEGNYKWQPHAPLPDDAFGHDSGDRY